MQGMAFSECKRGHIINQLVYSFLTLNLLTTTIAASPSNAGKWQMGFNSAFKGLKHDKQQFLHDELPIFFFQT